MKFIHLSDLHFHTKAEDNTAAIATLNFITDRYPDHRLIITGDITDDGKEEQCTAAYNALSPFTGRILICPGNHDFGAAGNFYSQERAERFDRLLTVPLKQGGTFTGDKTPVVNVVRDDTAEVMLIALNTNLETIHPFDFACGEVGNEQLAALKTILDTPNTFSMKKILFFHHHPFMHFNPFMFLLDARDLARTIYGRVDVMLFGHRHVSDIWPEYKKGVQYALAADNSPGKDTTREIEIIGNGVKVRDIPIR